MFFIFCPVYRVQFNGGLDVINDTDRRNEVAEEQDEDLGEDYEPERRTITAKAKPSMLETLRSFDGNQTKCADKKPPIQGKKSSEHEM